MDTLKNGGEILDEFFSKIEQLEGVDSDLAMALKDLYQKDKLSDKNITNALNDLRTGNE